MAKQNWLSPLKKDIERGRQGLNRGIPMKGFGTLSNYICNIQQGRYDVIFGGTSIGKTALADDAYVYGGINYLEDNPGYINDLEIIYYSLEITPVLKMAKYIAQQIWEDHGILTNINEIFSRGEHKIDPKVVDLIDSYSDKLQRIQDKYIFFKTSLSPQSLQADLLSYAKSRGTVVYDNQNQMVSYIPKNPNLITLVIIDHIGLINKGGYPTLKDAMDECSKTLVTFRNICNFSPLVISQINRSMEGMDRRDNGDTWMPMLSDIKSSGNMSEDANTVIGLASPYYLQIDKCLGFNISEHFKNRYRLLKICKNRDGDSNVLASMLFIGEIGKYHQLGKPEEYVTRAPDELRKIKEFYRQKENKLI